MFSEGAYVNAVLDVTNGFAYIQNAGTNAYLEERFDELLYSKTVLWQWGGGTAFRISTLSLPVDGYDAIEIVYKLDCWDPIISTSGEIPMPTDKLTSRCFLLGPSGDVNTTVSITNDGTFTFALYDDEYGTPWMIYGIKHGSSAGESGKVSYTNVLDRVGFQTDRCISSGDEEDNIGTDLTGYIEVAGGDVIRLKNVTMPDVEGYENRVYCYRWNKSLCNVLTMTSSNTANSPVFKNGNLVQFTILDGDIKEYIGDTGWIRIGAANIDSKSVITINEEIK